jgi:hypothetical protein
LPQKRIGRGAEKAAEKSIADVLHFDTDNHKLVST